MSKNAIHTGIKVVIFAMLAGLAMGCGTTTRYIIGQRGPIGPVGPQGPAGGSCTVVQGDGVALIQCEDGSSAIVRDGESAEEVEWIDPCPEIPATHPELILKQGDNYYAVYASGQRIHLSQLKEGVQYQTTDGRSGCKFKVEDL